MLKSNLFQGMPSRSKTRYIAYLIFAAPRWSEIPELLALKDIFEKMYGRDFVSDLRPTIGVNCQVSPFLFPF